MLGEGPCTLTTEPVSTPVDVDAAKVTPSEPPVNEPLSSWIAPSEDSVTANPPGDENVFPLIRAVKLPPAAGVKPTMMCASPRTEPGSLAHAPGREQRSTAESLISWRKIFIIAGQVFS